MISTSNLLLHYKRKDVQDAIVEHAKDKEIAVKFSDRGFGKRPDAIQYSNDVLELAKQGATSFHASEELWSNPLRLDPNMKRQDIDELRKGWDLVLDIDCKFLEYSKIAADLLVRAIKELGISSVSIKFSGNHGFHIGIPFEAFPQTVQGTETRLLFPEGARRIASYLQNIIKKRLIESMLKSGDIDSIISKTGKTFNELVKEGEFNPFEIVAVDTVLISSRHLYRMPYCFNEKSGLVSIPLDPEKVMAFTKDDAKPENVVVNKFKFLDRKDVNGDDARSLIVRAFDFEVKTEEEQEKKEYKDFEAIQDAIPQDFFPPCIKNILKGLDDGKKRSLFIVTNFLTSVGWGYDEIDKLMKEWNSKNKEQVREVLIKGHLRYHKQQKKKILPPNCQNKMYYKDMQICVPDNLCERIKNPVQYSRRKTYYMQNGGEGKKKKESKENTQKKNPPKKDIPQKPSNAKE